MNDSRLKDIALKIQAELSNELLRENEKLKQKIEVLQKEHCEDAISRKAAISVANDFDCGMVVRGLEKLPSVQPAQKREEGEG